MGRMHWGQEEVWGHACPPKGHSLGREGQGQEGSVAPKASNPGLALAGLAEEVEQDGKRARGLEVLVCSEVSQGPGCVAAATRL